MKEREELQGWSSVGIIRSIKYLLYSDGMVGGDMSKRNGLGNWGAGRKSIINYNRDRESVERGRGVGGLSVTLLEYRSHRVGGTERSSIKTITTQRTIFRGRRQ